MKLVVRPAIEDDLPALVQLMAELDQFYGDPVSDVDEERTAAIRDALFGTTALSRAIVAADGPDLAGLASYSLLWPAAGVTRSLYLKELYVREAWRRRGIGRQLMEEVQRLAVALSCSRVEWTTDVGNEAARKFYAALGVAASADKVMYRAPIDHDQR